MLVCSACLLTFGCLSVYLSSILFICLDIWFSVCDSMAEFSLLPVPEFPASVAYDFPRAIAHSTKSVFWASNELDQTWSPQLITPDIIEDSPESVVGYSAQDLRTPEFSGDDRTQLMSELRSFLGIDPPVLSDTDPQSLLNPELIEDDVWQRVQRHPGNESLPLGACNYRSFVEAIKMQTRDAPIIPNISTQWRSLRACIDHVDWIPPFHSREQTLDCVTDTEVAAILLRFNENHDISVCYSMVLNQWLIRAVDNKVEELSPSVEFDPEVAQQAQGINQVDKEDVESDDEMEIGPLSDSEDVFYKFDTSKN